MPVFDPVKLAEWTGGTWTRLPEPTIRGVAHDTRKLQEGGLFVAMVGARVDGHDLAETAKDAGAVAMLCNQGRTNALLPCLEVTDTGRALEQMAAAYRETLNPQQMIGITGSAGKTTVKDFLAAMLSAAGKTRSTQGNWNNFIGLPLSLLAMEPDDRFGVFELGMNAPGEIAALAEILKPDAALITSIGEAHLELFGHVAGIAEEKTSLLAALGPDDLAVLDKDSPWYAKKKSRCVCRTVRVSVGGDAEYIGEVTPGGLKVRDVQRNEEFEILQPLPGAHMVTNLLQAVAMARECGLRVDQIRAGLEKYTPAPMRWQRVELDCCTVINDAYNANPLSMRKSIRTFSEQTHAGEKWLILGGMGELGAAEKELHWVIGKELDAFGFDGVVLVGEKGSWIESGISRTPVWTVSDREGALAEIKSRIPKGAMLLLKASRAERLELILEELEK